MSNLPQQQQQQQLALDCNALAREIAHGPELFDKHGKPTSAVERYTGSRVTNDQERCLVVGALRLLRWSDRQIADAVKCDVRSIPLMVREAEKSGRIPALKERLQGIVGHNAEQSGIVLAQLLDRAAGGSDSVELSAMIKSVGMVNSYQVKDLQLLTGAATEILELRMGAGQAERDAWALAHAIPIRAEVSAVDSEPTATSPFPQQNSSVRPGRHEDDTESVRGPSAADQPRSPAPAPAPPGGGGALLSGGLEIKTVSEG